jgi:putative acetyltransferase
LLKILLPPYTLHYPEAWQAMKLNSPVFPESGTLKCVNALNDPKLW